MSTGSIQRRSGAIRSRGSAVLLRLVLLIAAWQGPIPWCHSHAAQATAESAGWLAEHLQTHHRQTHHRQQASPGSGLLGWHFHADFPARPVGEAPQPGQPPAEFPAGTVGGGRVADFYSGERLIPLSQVPAAEDPCLARAYAAERALASSPTGFFDGYAATLPLPLRFCILRC